MFYMPFVVFTNLCHWQDKHNPGCGFFEWLTPAGNDETIEEVSSISPALKAQLEELKSEIRDANARTTAKLNSMEWEITIKVVVLVIIIMLLSIYIK